MIGSAVGTCAGWGMLIGWFTFPWWGPPASRVYDAAQFVRDRRRLRARVTDPRPSLAVQPAGLGERVLDESIEEAERLYDRMRCERGPTDWTLGEIADYMVAIDHLTIFEPAEWM